MLSQLSVFYFLQELYDWPIFLALFSLQGILSVVLSTSSSSVIKCQKAIVINYNLFECISGFILVVYACLLYGSVGFVLLGSFISIPVETFLKLNGRQFYIYVFYSIINLIILIFLKSAIAGIIVLLMSRFLILLLMNSPNLLRFKIHMNVPNMNAYFLNRQNIVTHYLGLLFVNMDNGLVLKIFTSVGNLIGASLNVRNFKGRSQLELSRGRIVALNLGTIVIFLFGKDFSFSYGLVTLLQSFVSFLLWPLFQEKANLSLIRLLVLFVLLITNSNNLMVGYLLFESFNVLWRQKI